MFAQQSVEPKLSQWCAVAARAFRRGGASCLLTPLLEMCAVRSTISATWPVHVVDDVYRTRTGRTDLRRGFLPQITLAGVTPTITHLAKAIELLYL